MTRGMRMGWAALLVGAGLGMMGCGGTEETGPEPGGFGLPEGVASSFEGVYAMSQWTENDQGCDGPGSEVLATSEDQHFALVELLQLGASTLQLVSCIDVAECQAKAAAFDNMESVSYFLGANLSEQESDDVLTGFVAKSGFEESGTCIMREAEEHRLTRSGSEMTLDVVVKALPDRPAEDGFCVVDVAAALQEAAGAPCVEVAAVVGSRVADL